MDISGLNDDLVPKNMQIKSASNGKFTARRVLEKPPTTPDDETSLNFNTTLFGERNWMLDIQLASKI